MPWVLSAAAIFCAKRSSSSVAIERFTVKLVGCEFQAARCAASQPSSRCSTSASKAAGSRCTVALRASTWKRRVWPPARSFANGSSSRVRFGSLTGRGFGGDDRGGGRGPRSGQHARDRRGGRRRGDGRSLTRRRGLADRRARQAPRRAARVPPVRGLWAAGGDGARGAGSRSSSTRSASSSSTDGSSRGSSHIQLHLHRGLRERGQGPRRQPAPGAAEPPAVSRKASRTRGCRRSPRPR